MKKAKTKTRLIPHCGHWTCVGPGDLVFALPIVCLLPVVKMYKTGLRAAIGEDSEYFLTQVIYGKLSFSVSLLKPPKRQPPHKLQRK
ncbi:hypothetical protein LAZ67_10001843 [Cordylochernes scorpioides]|uniref:Uncharacterized protein n=1 Tax=Cordylochernes scorpioides TaxID=51811 RepID=A0ABY6KZJ4_9ARAC|nr:hypothetical protein LAZ67_10001843 [Cordylochernes scorpioides]